MFVILLLSILVTSQSIQLPTTEEINSITFLNNGKMLFITQSHNYFGFIAIQNGAFLTVQKVKQNQKIVSFNREEKYFVIRQDRQKAMIFRLEELFIRNIQVQITFQHQRIIDLQEQKGKVYVLTNKDLSSYDSSSQQLDQSSKVILTSGRKGEWFLKFFHQQQFFKIILIRNQTICIRILKKGEKYKQQCLFNLTSQISEISKIKRGILVQANDINYVIEDDLTIYSFNGKLLQVNHNFATFEHFFKSYYFSKKIIIDGLNVYGSTQEHQFWLTEKEDAMFHLVYNGETVGIFSKEDRPKRSWINQNGTDNFLFVYQTIQNKLLFKEINLQKQQSVQL